MRQVRLIAGIALLSCIILVGCDGSGMGTVNGTVTWNGEPLKEGIVNFHPTDGKTATASAPIKDGKFTVQLPVSTMKVQFSSPRPTGKKKRMYDTPDSPEIEIVDELLPTKYTTDSQLTLKIKGGTQEEKFELTK